MQSHDRTQEMNIFLSEGIRPPLLEGCPKPIEELMISCWEKQPEKRPSMENVVRVMDTLCELFSGADEPIVYPDSDCSTVTPPRIRFRTKFTFASFH